MVKSTTSKQNPLSREILVKELSALEKRIDTRFDASEKRLDTKIDSKMDIMVEAMKAHIDSRFVTVDKRFDEVDQRFATVDKRFAEVGLHFENVDKRFDRIEKKLDVSVKGLVQLIETRVVEDIALQGRVRKLEARIA